MDGSERLEELADEIARLEQVQADLVELFFDLATRSFHWQALMTTQIKQTAEAREAAHNLREELRRYTRKQIAVE